MTAVLGPNGCGKSTLFHLLCGSLKLTQGRILLDGRSIRDIPRREFARRVSIVHQYNLAPEDITVRKLVAMGRTPYHNMFSAHHTENDKKAVDRALEITDTAKYAQRPVRQLSGGQRQRVWLAMALAQDTEILLLDEITTYLDVYYQLQLLRLIAGLQREYGLTVVMVMHDINQAIEFCSQTVLMEDGHILASGGTNEIINEKNLLQAFHVETELHTLGSRRYCIYK
ncbi:MAG: ABC transporter ATP-binding protein [Clostridiales bacterium]|nr:ABC transporter ATP-binding protein [Clostridiales bacterium]